MTPRAIDKTPLLGPVNADGFAGAANLALYHVGTGLHCPAFLGDLPRTETHEYRKNIDASCGYQLDGREATIYVYQNEGDLDGDFRTSLYSVTQGNLANRLGFSENLTKACQSVANAQSLPDVLMDAVSKASQGNEVTIYMGGNAPNFQYRVGAFEGNGLRSYAAMSETDKMYVKLRYSVNGNANSEDALKAECETVYKIVRQMKNAVGKSDGAATSSLSGLRLKAESNNEADS